jgi:hypothetical protein
MTTSGSTVFGLTRNELIAAAIRKTGRLASGQVPSTQQYTDGAQALNAIVAQLQTLGMPLWGRTSTQFALTLDTGTYTIGSGLTINVPAPLKIYQAFAVNTANSPDTGTEMQIVSLFDNTLSVTETSGSLPTQLSYQPKIDAGLITIWPKPDATAVSDIQIKIIYQRPFEMFTASGETMDIPKEWHQVVIYSLAVALAPEWGVPLADRQLLSKEADKHLELVMSFGQEDGSIYFSPTRQ